MSPCQAMLNLPPTMRDLNSYNQPEENIEAASARYERAFKDKNEYSHTSSKMDNEYSYVMRILRSSNLNGLDQSRVSRRWCLVRTLQDPNGRELAALVDGNRLIEATVPTADELKELWASRKGKDILRKRNKQVEMLSSYPENTKILDQYFQ